ncbi:hypothetical protein NRF20_16555 [Streptomyces sp. R-74717]|uniref:hypothetical protein n=1 Tax=Streptomyces TaxID=1883 RepID=UPI003789965A
MTPRRCGTRGTAGVSRRGAVDKAYAINKTLKVKKHKAYLIIRGKIADAANERVECHQISHVYFYLKQKS